MNILLHDKVQHFVFGAATSLPTLHFVHPHMDRVIVGAVAGAVVGTLKELYDKFHRKQPFSPLDILATAAGGLYAGLVS